MNRRQRKRRYERALRHQAKTRGKGSMASVPATKPRRRALSKRAVRKMGRKVRS